MGMDTGIFIRAYVEGSVFTSGKESRWESIDIGDPRLRADQLLEWLASKDYESIIRTMVTVKARLRAEGLDGDDGTSL